MQAALREYAAEVRRTHGVALQSRIGLNSGEVVVRALRNDVQPEYSAVGPTTHLAARMEQAAAPGHVAAASQGLTHRPVCAVRVGEPAARCA